VIHPEGTTMELFTAFDRVVASTADVVKATPAGQMSAPTRAPSGTCARC